MEERILKRSEKILKRFDEYKIEALLLTKEADIHYVTDLPGEDCAVLLTKDKKYLITDFRYQEAMKVVKPDFELIITGNNYELMDFLKEIKPNKLGVQNDTVTLDEYNQLCEFMERENIISATGLVEEIRFIKDEVELKYLEKAEAIGDMAFEHILGFLKPGISERRVAAELEYIMKMNGADGTSFDTIAVSGVNSSKPHGIPGDKLLEDGDFLTLDFGCKYKGYCSDMTRTVAIGHATEEMKEIYNIVLESQLYCCENLKAGMHVKDGDALARDIIKNAGYGEYFGHGTGHGVGLEIHEDPYLSFKGKHILEPNMIITIEPGIYLPDKFGVRIEDMVVIEESGIRNLAHSPKELIIIK